MRILEVTNVDDESSWCIRTGRGITIVILKLIFLLRIHSQLANFENSTAFPITFTELIQLWQLLIGNWVPLIHRKLYHQVKGRRKDSYLKSCLYATKELAFMAFQQSILGQWEDTWPC